MLKPSTQNYLYTLRRRGIKIGLNRTEALLARCGNPHKDIPVIHIAGTNGKGSTAIMIASILRQTGTKIGLYTSPHLVRFNERIQINGVPIPDDRIERFLSQYRKDIDLLGSTFFETTTALTFSYLADEQVEVAVIEVGLGGRLDSTNVARSTVSVLTPIDYDHMEFLGYDLSSIAREKCGILKEDVPAVVSAQRAEVMKTIQELASSLRIDVHLAPEISQLGDIITTQNRTRFSIGDNELTIPLPGRHQATNAQTAITATRLFDSSIEMNTIAIGLRKVRWPARLQKMTDEPPVFYDVAHNAHGLQAVLTTVRELFPNKNIGCICALKKTKELQPIAQLLKRYSHEVITTMPDHDGFFTPAALARQLGQGGVNTVAARSVQEALGHCGRVTTAAEVWLIFGTHYIAESVFKEFDFPFDKGEI